MTTKKNKTRELIESLVIAIVIALFVRSFIIQAYKIPSGSMEPTLLIGDHLLVNRMSYVVKIPILDKIIFSLGKPKRGDIIVFRYPEDPSKDFIKRVIAVEGDTIEIKNKTIYINGKKAPDNWGRYRDGMNIMAAWQGPRDNIKPYLVPKDAYFAMGDNRDNSADSRFWGPVRKENLVGRALVIYFSWNSSADSILDYVRWSRIGSIIK